MKKVFYIIMSLTFIFNSMHGIANADNNKRENGIYPKINTFVGSRDFSKYHTLAVLQFSDAPNSPNSGQIAQGLASRVFAQTGFRVSERARLLNIIDEQKLSSSGLINESQSIKIGRLLGVKAIVVGEVSQYQSIMHRTEARYASVCEFVEDTNMFALSGASCAQQIPVPGKQWLESYAATTFRVIDVETAEVVYSASGYYEIGLTSPPQEILDSLLQWMVAGWVK